MASIIPESASSRHDPQNIPIENHPHSYRIAYLRGCIQELLKLYLFELVQKGNLAIAEEKHWYGTKRWLVAVADTPDQHYLSPLERRKRPADSTLTCFWSNVDRAGRNLRYFLLPSYYLQRAFAHRSAFCWDSL